MKKLTRKFLPVQFAAIALLITGTSLATEETTVIRLSEPVEQTAEAEIFGSSLDASVPAVSLASIASDGEKYVGQSVRVDARVSQVCQKKGCFFIAREGDSIVRVSFKDYGFFVPTDISGKRVTFVGEVVSREVSADEAEHLAEDLGSSSETVKPVLAYEIVARSVRVPKG